MSSYVEKISVYYLARDYYGFEYICVYMYFSFLPSFDGKTSIDFDGSRILLNFSASVIKHFVYFKAFITGGDISQEQQAGKCGTS